MPPTPALSQLPTHRTKDSYSHKHNYHSRATGRASAIYLTNKELELVRQNPRARVEVVLVWKQVLHDSQCSAQSDFTHHLRHAWGEEKL